MERLPKIKYKSLVFPIEYDRSFLDFTTKEIEDYFKWFLLIKDERIKHLCEFLFSSRNECLQESNLLVIEIFMQTSVSAITKPEKQILTEVSKIPSHLRDYAKPDDYLLDSETLSICFDIGIFLGDMIILFDKNINWALESDNEYADFGQPILKKKGIKLRLNPFRVTKNIAAKMLEDKYREGELLDVFSAWKKGYKVSV